MNDESICIFCIKLQHFWDSRFKILRKTFWIPIQDSRFKILRKTFGNPNPGFKILIFFWIQTSLIKIQGVGFKKCFSESWSLNPKNIANFPEFLWILDFKFKMNLYQIILTFTDDLSTILNLYIMINIYTHMISLSYLSMPKCYQNTVNTSEIWSSVRFFWGVQYIYMCVCVYPLSKLLPNSNHVNQSPNHVNTNKSN